MTTRSTDSQFPEDEARLSKGDIFAYGRKKSLESGKSSKDYLNQRSKDYARYGLGFGITMVGNINGSKVGKTTKKNKNLFVTKKMWVDTRTTTSRIKKKTFGKKGWKS